MRRRKQIFEERKIVQRLIYRERKRQKIISWNKETASERESKPFEKERRNLGIKRDLLGKKASLEIAKRLIRCVVQFNRKFCEIYKNKYRKLLEIH